MTKRVFPTYDRDHYAARAARYAQAALNEPDPGVRKALEAAAEACRQKAAGTADRTVLDC
jgi:hypothetical protein